MIPSILSDPAAPIAPRYRFSHAPNPAGLLCNILGRFAISVCAALLGATIIAGCGPVIVPAAPEARPATEPAATQPGASATQPTDQAASPDLLERKAQSYAEAVQHLLNPAPVTQPATKPAAPPPKPAPMPIASAPTSAPVAQPTVAPQLQPTPQPPPPAVQVAISPPSPPPAPVTQPTGKPTLAQRIDRLAHDEPTDAAAQLDQQLLEFVRGNAVPEAGSLAQLPNEDREVLSTVLDGLSNYRDVLRHDPTATNSRKLLPLLEMSSRLKSQADLAAPVFRLCSAVRGFGNYDAIDVNNLHAGVSIRAIVYCQVTNFVSQLDAQQEWETRLTERLALYSEADGQMVWNHPAQPIVDHCRDRRHDLYCYTLIDLPATLSAGQYLLKATLEDQISNKVAEATLPITIK